VSRILSRRLASGVGAGDLRWIEEWGTAFWKIVRKASTVEGVPRPTRLSMKGMRGSGAITDSADWRFWAKLSCFGIGITNVFVSRSRLPPHRPSIPSRFALDTACACLS
jgi:hypothetical protein